MIFIDLCVGSFFPADCLVAVHVCDVLDVGLADHVLVGGGGDHHHPQLTTLKEGKVEVVLKCAIFSQPT